MSESGTITPNDEAFGVVTDQLEKDLLALLSSPLESLTGDSIEYSESAEFDDAGAGTAFQWEIKAREAYESLSAFLLSEVKQTEDPLGGSASLRMPSVFEMVSETIRSNIESNEPIKTLSQLTEEREAMLSQSDLPSFKLRSAFEGNDKANLDALKAMRFQLPQTNLVVDSPPAGYSEGPQQAVVSVQIYRKLGSREIKILAADFALTQTLFEMFRFIVNLFPESRMWDGPLLSASGLVIVGDDMYTTGPEDYANSYSVWLNQFGLSHTIQPMESVKLGELRCVGGKDTSCCFIQFCGSEILRLFFSNLSFAPSSPRITYKRKLPRPIKCVLCRTRAANLVIVNDVMLPLNPSHCCNSCYRRLRSDGNGHFLMPPETVVVSEYCTI